MKCAAVFALAAMLPAAIHPAPAARARSFTALLCNGDGFTRQITIPVKRDELPSPEEQPCWAKGCHVGSTRKRDFRFS
jgi:hypothetical protein